MLKSKCEESARNGNGVGKHASKAVSSDEMQLAHSKKTLGRSNPRALITTVHQLCLTGFGCRAIKEQYAILNKDLVYGPTHKSGFPEYIELNERITKTRRGGVNQKRDVECGGSCLSR